MTFLLKNYDGSRLLSPLTEVNIWIYLLTQIIRDISMYSAA